MAVSFIGSVSALDQVTIPAHAVGDLILVAAYCMDGNGTAPTLPAAFTEISHATASDAWLLAYKIATSTSDASGHWGADSLVLCSVFRGADTNQPIGAWAANSGTADAGVTYPGLTLQTPGGTSWVAAFASSDSTTVTLGTAPSGMTRREGFAALLHKGASFDTNGTVTSFSSRTVGPTGTGTYRTHTIEVRATPNQGNLSAAISSSTVSSTAARANSGNLFITLPAVTLASQLTHGISGNVTASLAATTSVSVAAHMINANLSASIAGATLAASAEHGRYGTLTATIAGATLAASAGHGRYGTLTATIAGATLTGSLTHGINANLSASIAGATLAASAEHGRYANLSASIAGATLAASAASLRTGGVSATLAGTTMSSTAHLEPFPILRGYVAATLKSATLSSLAQHPASDTVEPPPWFPDRSHCVDIDAQVEAEINHVLTQYRESPNLLFVIRNMLRQVAEAGDSICNLPEWFDLDHAVGDQLTLIGKRLGFPRCHCVCVQPPVFGFDCEGGGAFGQPIVGFCEIGSWADCADGGIAEICIDDDDIYRRFLQVRCYQALRRYDYASLKACATIMYGPTAKIMEADNGHVVIAPFRILTDTEKNLLKLVPRIMPVAPGIRLLFHFSVYPVTLGFGEGWGGFCDDIPISFIKTDSHGDAYLPLETGPDYLDPGETTRNAYWLCPTDVKPYSC